MLLVRSLSRFLGAISVHYYLSSRVEATPYVTKMQVCYW
jgi:hypothetical protein